MPKKHQRRSQKNSKKKRSQKRSSNNYFQDISVLPAYTEVPPMQLSDFMRAYADIDDPREAYMHLNVISQEAYGELEVSEIDKNGDYVISGRMFNPVVRERCIDVFWDLWFVFPSPDSKFCF